MSNRAEGFIVQPEDYVEDEPVDPIPPTPAPTAVRSRQQRKIYSIILIVIMYILIVFEFILRFMNKRPRYLSDIRF